jgi:hypothetical protein
MTEVALTGLVSAGLRLVATDTDAPRHVMTAARNAAKRGYETFFHCSARSFEDAMLTAPRRAAQVLHKRSYHPNAARALP